MNANEKIKAAYALNLWTVSISQIVDYDDVNIMEQEYDIIMNNLNLENMPKDEALLDVIKEIMDEITNLRMEDGDRKIIEREYQHRLKNAVWSAVPNVGAIFATANPVALGLTLATQIGIGYMNYRRNKAQYALESERSKWRIQRNRMQHLNGLQKQLFETAWRLADAYEFPDEYRLTAKQISEYNQALMESNPVKRYNSLNAMRPVFNAYPAFWYQIGSTANSIYRSKIYASDIEIQAMYKAWAVECFEKYSQLNKFNLLRHDVLTSSWALEYLELQDMSRDNNLNKAVELIGIAEKYSGNSLDVLELCAFAYLRLQDDENAIRLFHLLVNKDYNAVINTQILSGLYIKRMHDGNPKQAREARIGYTQLPYITDPKNILKTPPEGADLSQWKPAWNRQENFDEFVGRKAEEKRQEKERREEARKKARLFYQQPILLVYSYLFEEVADYFLCVLNENRKKIDPSLPSPSHCVLKDYIRNREEIERKGTHIIMIGDSSEAKKLYRNTKSGRWDYYHLGMRYISYGDKTVLLTRTLQNEQINDLISLAKEIEKKHSIKIPSQVKTVSYDFVKELFEEKDDNAAKGLPIVGQILGEVIKNSTQSVQNLAAWKKLELLQYHIAIYKYLESEQAIVE